MNDEDFTALMERSEEDLLGDLGQILLGEGRGLGPIDPESWRAFAHRWIETRHGELKRLVCDDPRVIAFQTSTPGLLEAATVADCVLGLLNGHALGANVVAVILVRRGLGMLCGDVP